MTTSPFISIEKAITIMKEGGMLILVDDEDRENEGDLIIAADHVTPDAINFMARFGRGLICLPMANALIDKLALPMMSSFNQSPYGTAFTVSIEASTGVSTGISAKDRAHTIKTAIAKDSGPADLITPGHIFPLRAREAGVLERPGQTEGSVDLAKLAGLTAAAVICEIMNEDGSMSRRDDLYAFANLHQIPMVTIRDLIEYRIRHETLVQEQVVSRLPLQNRGDFNMTVFRYLSETAEHFALVKAPKDSSKPPLVRIHSECITGDVFASCKCDCGSQLELSLDKIAEEGGILIYLRQEGRGIGLVNKLKAYALQEQGFDTVEANLELGLPVDIRDYAVAYQILRYFNISSVRLLTNNPKKVATLCQYGVDVVERIALVTEPTAENRDYLRTKQEKMGHYLSVK